MQKKQLKLNESPNPFHTEEEYEYVVKVIPHDKPLKTVLKTSDRGEAIEEYITRRHDGEYSDVEISCPGFEDESWSVEHQAERDYDERYGAGEIEESKDKKQMWEQKLTERSKKLKESYSDMASDKLPDGTSVMASGSTRSTRTYNYEEVNFRLGSKSGFGKYGYQNRSWQRFDFASALKSAMVDAGIESAFADECIDNSHGLDSAIAYFAKNYKVAGKEVTEAKQGSGDYSKLFADFLELIEFELIKTDESNRKATSSWDEVENEGPWALHDRQDANLGDIESDRFENAMQMADRLDIYINDYMLRDDEWGEFDSLEDLLNDSPEHPLRELADMLVHHTEEVDLNRVYELMSGDVKNNVNESHDDKELLDAVMDSFGMSKDDALEYIKKASDKTKKELVKGFRQDAKKNFYDGEESLDEEKQEVSEYDDDSVKLAKKIANALRLSKSDFEMLVHDLNNLRGAEWLDTIEAIKDKALAKEFKDFVNYDEDELDEAKKNPLSDIKIEKGHSLREYNKKFGQEYNEGDLWDVSYEDLKNGALEPNKDIVYWEIDGRLFETTLEADEESLKEARGVGKGQKLDKYFRLVSNLLKDNLSKEEIEKLEKAKSEVEKFEPTSEYEKKDKKNLLDQIERVLKEAK